MSPGRLLIAAGKLVLGGAVFSLGVVLGGMTASLLGLQPPQMPEGLDPAAAMVTLMLTSPLLALGLALVARGLTGGFWARALALAWLTWIAYTVNTQLEAAIFTSISGGFWFTLVDFLVPSALVGLVVAWLFPPVEPREGVVAAWGAFFSRRTGWDWAWRLALAAVIFMPIYYGFGLLVVPFTASYYQQSMYGLQMPGLNQILATLFARSLLFLAACLPVIALWRRSRLELSLSLGFALFVLVGLLYMLAATYMPVSVRLPHTLEILADEFVYAGALVVLLSRPPSEPQRRARPTQRPATA